MSNPNEPAYPGMTHIGMTIRQQFVMAAMQGLAPRSATGSADRIKWIAAEAVRLADAALAEEARTRVAP